MLSELLAQYNNYNIWHFLTSGFDVVEYLLDGCRYFFIFEYILMIYIGLATKMIDLLNFISSPHFLQIFWFFFVASNTLF